MNTAEGASIIYLEGATTPLYYE